MTTRFRIGSVETIDSLDAERHAALAQSVERFTRNEKVRSSILLGGSTVFPPSEAG